jgi:nicotinamide riboside kinase
MPELVYKKDEKRLEEFDKNIQWFQNNYNDLKKEFKGQYVAINNQEVIDHDKDYNKLLERIKEKFGGASEFVIEFISDKRFNFIL